MGSARERGGVRGNHNTGSCQGRSHTATRAPKEPAVGRSASNLDDAVQLEVLSTSCSTNISTAHNHNHLDESYRLRYFQPYGPKNLLSGESARGPVGPSLVNVSGPREVVSS